MIKKRALLSIILLTAVLIAGCSSTSNSPTQPPPDNAQLVTTRSQAFVDGTPLAGATRHQGFGEGSSMLFEGAMTLGNQPGIGEMMWMEYDRPMGGGGMHGNRHTGRTQLYDDGTHGDDMPGDGIYHFEDFDGDFGCQRQSHGAGDYHYEFYGEHHDGSETNRIGMTITING